MSFCCHVVRMIKNIKMEVGLKVSDINFISGLTKTVNNEQEYIFNVSLNLSREVISFYCFIFK